MAELQRIAAGPKTIENWVENFPRPYRGLVLIHAGKQLDRFAFAGLEDRIKRPVPEDLPRGSFIGVAEIVDVVSRSSDEWFGEPLGLVLANARALPFKPWRGQLGLFGVPFSAVRRLLPTELIESDD